jgi:hypothetical protein
LSADHHKKNLNLISSKILSEKRKTSKKNYGKFCLRTTDNTASKQKSKNRKNRKNHCFYYCSGVHVLNIIFQQKYGRIQNIVVKYRV